MTPVTLTQNSYRLWARIGPSVTMYGVALTGTSANVALQLAQMVTDNTAAQAY